MYIQLRGGINKPTKLRNKSSQKEWRTKKLDHLHKRRNAVGADIQFVSKVIMKLWQQSGFTQVFMNFALLQHLKKKS